MTTAIDAIRTAILEGAPGDELAALPLPEASRGALVRAEDQNMFDGMPSEKKDPRTSVRVEEFPLPELAPDEALVAVMASSINFNTVWTSIFEPLPTFGFLKRLGKESVWGARHDQPYHVMGSDAAGVVLRAGSAVRNWKPGDAVTVHCNYVDDQDPSAHDDSMLATNQRIWGFESNFGGLADLSIVKANQLMPKPAHLTWEEAAVNALTNSTSYRMIVSPNGSQMTQGQTVLDLGCERRHRCVRVPVRPQRWRHAGRRRVVTGAAADLLHELGVEAVINRKEEGYRFWDDEGEQDPGEWRRFGKKIRELAGTDPDIVFEHPGRQTMGASVFVCKRGGMIITCAATSGYMIEYDNRYLWMMLKTLKGCHFANYREAWEANRLICEGKIFPTLSKVFSLAETGEAAYQMHHNLHEGKLGILCLAPEEGLGVTDGEMRERLLPQITLFRRYQ